MASRTGRFVTFGLVFLVAFVFFVSGLSSGSEAQARKVYISVDMEAAAIGITP